MAEGTRRPVPEDPPHGAAASVAFDIGPQNGRFRWAAVKEMAALAARGAIIVWVISMALALVVGLTGHDVAWGAIAVAVGVAFVAVMVLLAVIMLFSTERIEFRPASAPTDVHLISLVRTRTVPIALVRRVTLTDRLTQSPTYPFTLSSSGSVKLALELRDGVAISGRVREPVERLAERLTELLRPAGVPVEVGAEPEDGYDPGIVDDRLPPDGIVLAIMRRRQSGNDFRRPRPGYLSVGETEEAWPTVWWVQKVAEANQVRMRWFSAGSYRLPVRWADFRAVDVQRVADEIAAGTAVVDPSWRGDTEDGLAAKAAFLKKNGNR